MTATFTAFFSCPESRVLELAQIDGEKLYTLLDIRNDTGLSHRTVKRVIGKFQTLKFVRPERKMGNAILYKFDIPLIGAFLKEAMLLAIRVSDPT